MIWLETVGCERDGKLVLEGITMGIARGELIVIEGAVASGKSTLLEAAAVRRLPDRGTVWFAGRNVLALQRSSLPFVRRNIGYAGPEPLLVPDETVLANVMLALAVRDEAHAAAETLARAALTLLGADELAGRQVASLSSGQKRLVALARALAGPPPAVVVDEPAALADPDTRQRIVAALVAVSANGSAVLCATAEAALADALVEQGGKKIHLAQGRIVGAPAVELVRGFTPEPVEVPQGRVIDLELDDDDEALPARGPA